MGDSIPGTITKGIALDRLDECGLELLEDGPVHIYPLEVETDLSRVEEREERNLEQLETWSMAWLMLITFSATFCTFTSGKTIAGSFPPLFPLDKYKTGWRYLQFESNPLQRLTRTL